MKKILLWIVAMASLSGSLLHAQEIVGMWQGTLAIGKDLREVIKISKADGGTLKAVMYSIDEGGRPMNANTASFDGSALTFSIVSRGALYEGKLAPDGKTITGTFTQAGKSMALVLTRATTETAWTIPDPPVPPKAMAADADPGFEVVTVKPTDPDFKGRGYGMRGHQYGMRGFTLGQLIEFSYRLHARQVIGLPGWAESDKFDIDGTPDQPGRPSDQQMRSMMRKLLADRFGLKFHHDTKELSVFALSVAKGGPKLKPTASEPASPSGFGFPMGARGGFVCSGTNVSMHDFAGALQEVVLDRPVPDLTQIVGRFDIALTFTPDDTQMPGIPKSPAPPDNTEPPPPLFKAIQDQLGLKLEATKLAVEVLVIDHVEKPSDN